MMLSAAARAKSICVIAKAVHKGLPRSHTERCGECKRIAGQIRAAVKAERERCARAVEAEALVDNTGHDQDVAYDSAIRDAAAAVRRKPGSEAG